MAQYITGITDATNMSDLQTLRTERPNAYMIALQIELGNTVAEQRKEELNAFLDQFIEERGIRKGERLPITTHDVYWSQGGINSDAPMFRKKTQTYKFKRQGWNLSVFQFTDEQIQQADENDVDLYANVLEDVIAIRRSYIESYLVNQKMLALLAGSSLSTEMPAVNTGGEYADNFGALRGEDVTSFLMHTTDENDNGQRTGYRARKGATLDYADIQDVVDYLTGFKSYKGGEIIALARGGDINELAKFYNYEANQDALEFSDLVSGRNFKTRRLGDVNYKTSNSIKKGFFIFISMSALRRLILRAMSPKERYRGLAMFSTSKDNLFDAPENMEGAKMHIFPEAYFLKMREAIVVFDAGNQGDANGHFDTASETSLNNWLTRIRKEFDDLAQID